MGQSPDRLVTGFFRRDSADLPALEEGAHRRPCRDVTVVRSPDRLPWGSLRSPDRAATNTTSSTPTVSRCSTATGSHTAQTRSSVGLGNEGEHR